MFQQRKHLIPTRVEEIQRIKTESPTVKGCPYNIRIVQNKLLDEKIEMWKKNILLFYFFDLLGI